MQVKRPAGLVAGLFAVATGILHISITSNYRGPLRPFVTGYLIDILLPAALFLVLGLCPYLLLTRTAIRAVLVFGVGAFSETLQGFGFHFAGSTFDPLDYAAYAGGVGIGFLIEVLENRTRERRR
jgi:hypothetical protein